jgi:RHS repeat-associated protein
MTGADSAANESAVYRPFGEQQAWVLDASVAGEDKGFIGERYDADAGLQYLNARYYDPRLGLFLQPDWFEVSEPGVGTNRYGYSFNDPVNLSDPGGNSVWDKVVESLRDSWNNFKDHFSRDRETRVSAREYNRANREVSFLGSYGEWKEFTAIAEDLSTRDAGTITASGGGLLRNPAGFVVGAAVVAADQLGRARMNITYVAVGPGGSLYIGRASCYCSTPQEALDRRWSRHHMAAAGFGNPAIDVHTTGDYLSLNWAGIRGREQQLMDYHGGVGKIGTRVANAIRGVSDINPLGRFYHETSNAMFGPLAPYTGRW